MLRDAAESLHVRAVATQARVLGYEPRRELWRGMLVCEGEGDAVLLVDVQEHDGEEGPMRWEPDGDELAALDEAVLDFFQEHPWCREVTLVVALVRLKEGAGGASIRWNQMGPVRADKV